MASYLGTFDLKHVRYFIFLFKASENQNLKDYITGFELDSTLLCPSLKVRDRRVTIHSFLAPLILSRSLQIVSNVF